MILFFVSEFGPSEMVPFLLRNFRPFFKWYHFVGNILAYSEMVPFLTPFFVIPGVERKFDFRVLKGAK